MPKEQDKEKSNLGLYAALALGLGGLGAAGYYMNKNKDKIPKPSKNIDFPTDEFKKVYDDKLDIKDNIKRILQDPSKQAGVNLLRNWYAIRAAGERINNKDIDIPMQSGLHRVRIQDKLDPEELKRLGFVKSLIAIPERGQAQWMTYRHPTTNFHLHNHDDGWYMHRDGFTPLQLALTRTAGGTVGAKTGAITGGLGHLITEGIPGGAQYLDNVVGAAPSFQNIQKNPDKYLEEKALKDIL